MAFHSVRAVARLALVSEYKIDLQGGGGTSAACQRCQRWDAPFWETFRQALRAGRARPATALRTSTRGWCLAARDALVPFVDYRGPFPFYYPASGFHYNKSLSFAHRCRGIPSGPGSGPSSCRFRSTWVGRAETTAAGSGPTEDHGGRGRPGPVARPLPGSGAQL